MVKLLFGNSFLIFRPPITSISKTIFSVVFSYSQSRNSSSQNKIENQNRGNIEVIYKNEEDWEEIDSQ